MKIRLCTFTGADDAVDPVDLASLSRSYPFVEWAVSYDPSRAGQARYPSAAWVSGFLETCGSAHKAMHLSGAGLSEFVAGNTAVLEYVQNFQRVELNLDYEMDRTVENIFALIEQLKKFPAKEFILGLNHDTKHLLPRFADVNLSVLFDSSGGTGKKPEIWPKPLKGYECGYAGGIRISTRFSMC
jgi:hypothetical protein